jgi:hypothetical protein
MLRLNIKNDPFVNTNLVYQLRCPISPVWQQANHTISRDIKARNAMLSRTHIRHIGYDNFHSPLYSSTLIEVIERNLKS